MNFNKLILVITLIIFLSPAVDAAVTHTYNFNQPDIKIVSGKAIVTIEDCWTTGTTGHPALPVYGGNLLLPPGMSGVSITCQVSEPVSLGSGFEIEPVQAQYPLSSPGPHPFTNPDPLVYNADIPYPALIADGLNTQFRRGHSLGYFAVHPVTYNPVTGELFYYSSVTVIIETAPTAESQTAFSTLFRARDRDGVEVQAQVDNPAELAEYPAGIDETDDLNIDYLIITDEELYDSFQILADYKNARGTKTEVVLKSWIEANYSGFDVPAKMRTCIIDYYYNLGTDYVLLAGDNENVPKRSLYAQMGGEIDPDIAADLYFGCLDGNFNADGDEYMGEPNDQPDLVAEVYVGRAGVDSPTEAENFIAKQIAYQHTPVADEIMQGLMLGEDLEWLVWGSAYKEEIRLGSSMWGYTTEGFPNWFGVDTLYDYPGFHWSAAGDLLPLLNEGPQLVNHLGHANNTYTLKFGSSGINDNSITNNGINHNFYIIYSQGCYCNSWDNRTPDFGLTGSDAIAEKWTSIENGAVCFIGNTRYGWGNYTTTNGASQYGDRQFFDALFGENILEIGRAQQDSKEDCIPFLNNVTYYCYYECCLLGDPTLQVWTEQPGEIIVTADTLINIGDTTFTLQVENVSDAVCAISQNSQLLGSSNSGSLGSVIINLSEPISSTEPVRLMVTKPNYLPNDVYLDVYIPDSPNLLFNGCSIDDESFDGDGIADLGESPYLALTITNFGGVDAGSVTANISSNDLFLQIMDGEESLGNIGHDQTVEFTSAFQLQVTDDVEDGHTAEFTLTLTDGVNNQWSYEFNIEASAPFVVLSNVVIDDGNDQKLTPGEFADIELTFGNTGSGEARVGTAVIYTDNPYLNIISDTGNFDLLVSGGVVTSLPSFEVQASSACPLSANIPVYVDIYDEMGYFHTTLFEIIIGGIFESFEGTVTGWDSEVVTSGWNDEWILSDNRNYTLNGMTSWHCGPANGSNYTNHLDAGLLSPVYDILPGATLTLRHWMDAEVSQSMPGTCYDGGIVEMSLDGNAFMQLYPAAGYNYYIRDYPADMGPFPAHYQVYSGNIFWEEAVFDLDIFPDGEGILRFRFGSNGSGTREGWYVDDIEMTYYNSVSPPTNFAGSWADTVTVELTWNSPGGSQPSAAGKGGERETDALLHYNVYRNAIKIAEVQALTYSDDLRPHAAGTYSYTVTALFNKGESDPTEPLIFEYETTGVDDISSLVPDKYFIDQNYPNPFNPVTNLRYGLPEPGNIRIAVFDITGRETAVLVEGYQQAGYHTVIWNAEQFSSGIYFYRMDAKDFSQSGKMLLIK